MDAWGAWRTLPPSPNEGNALGFGAKPSAAPGSPYNGLGRYQTALTSN
jgi:hypothetical protein